MSRPSTDRSASPTAPPQRHRWEQGTRAARARKDAETGLSAPHGALGSPPCPRDSGHGSPPSLDSPKDQSRGVWDRGVTAARGRYPGPHPGTTAQRGCSPTDGHGDAFAASALSSRRPDQPKKPRGRLGPRLSSTPGGRGGRREAREARRPARPRHLPALALAERAGRPCFRGPTTAARAPRNRRTPEVARGRWAPRRPPTRPPAAGAGVTARHPVLPEPTPRSRPTRFP